MEQVALDKNRLLAWARKGEFSYTAERISRNLIKLVRESDTGGYFYFIVPEDFLWTVLGIEGGHNGTV